MKIYGYRWKSRVNIIPIFGACTIVQDSWMDRPGEPVKRLLEIIWLGFVLHITWPAARVAKAWSWPQ